jgi:putative ABC transport system permease protein
MIRFLLKGILNDRSRSLLPIVVVAIGVALIVLLDAWLRGVMGESLVMNANFSTGHVKVMTRAYADNQDQVPNDLALLSADSTIEALKRAYPAVDWNARIKFGGLIDFPDDNGETRAQGPVAGWALDLLTPGTREDTRFNLDRSIVSGAMIKSSGDALVTADLADKLSVKPGDRFTLFSSTMDGAMAFGNFRVCGLVRFGSVALDRGGMIIDISDARRALSMNDAAGEILGYFEDGAYNNEMAQRTLNEFNTKVPNQGDEFAPVMVSMRGQGGMAEYIDYTNTARNMMTTIFVVAMAVVLWNAGLLGGLRRYNEFGMRLALGEEKGHLYRTLIYEGALIGVIGSMVGTGIGISAGYYLEVVGVNIGGSLKNSTLMMPSVVRADVTPASLLIGFGPGVIAMVLGNALSGVGIYKRKTAQLIKDLEV